MTLQSSIRKIYFGVADRRQMFRLFDRHAQRPNRWENDDSALFAGEWFEIARAEHDYTYMVSSRRRRTCARPPDDGAWRNRFCSGCAILPTIVALAVPLDHRLSFVGK